MGTALAKLCTIIALFLALLAGIGVFPAFNLLAFAFAFYMLALLLVSPPLP